MFTYKNLELIGLFQLNLFLSYKSKGLLFIKQKACHNFLEISI